MLVHLKPLAQLPDLENWALVSLRSLLNIVLKAWIHHLFLLRLVIVVGVSVSCCCRSS